MAAPVTDRKRSAGSRCLGLALAFLVFACAAPPIPESPLVFSEPRAFNRDAVTSGLFRPEGDGRFPAVVLLHTCGGLGQHVIDWAARLLAEGYVALVIDSFGPRGFRNCGSPRTFPVSLDQVAGDALAALVHLRSLPYVDGDRVGVIGFSWGAMAALRLASGGYRARSPKIKEPFSAAVAFYPYCATIHPDPRVHDRLNNLYDDTDVPVLILIGDADDETPAAQCVERAETLQKNGRPVAIRVYPGATHGFDWAELGVRTVINLGRYTHRHEPTATADAAKEVSAFLGRHLGRSR